MYLIRILLSMFVRIFKNIKNVKNRIIGEKRYNIDSYTTEETKNIASFKTEAGNLNIGNVYSPNPKSYMEHINQLEAFYKKYNNLMNNSTNPVYKAELTKIMNETKNSQLSNLQIKNLLGWYMTNNGFGLITPMSISNFVTRTLEENFMDKIMNAIGLNNGDTLEKLNIGFAINLRIFMQAKTLAQAFCHKFCHTTIKSCKDNNDLISHLDSTLNEDTSFDEMKLALDDILPKICSSLQYGILSQDIIERGLDTIDELDPIYQTINDWIKIVLADFYMNNSINEEQSQLIEPTLSRLFKSYYLYFLVTFCYTPLTLSLFPSIELISKVPESHIAMLWVTNPGAHRRIENAPNGTLYSLFPPMIIMKDPTTGPLHKNISLFTAESPAYSPEVLTSEHYREVFKKQMAYLESMNNNKLTLQLITGTILLLGGAYNQPSDYLRKLIINDDCYSKVTNIFRNLSEYLEEDILSESYFDKLIKQLQVINAGCDYSDHDQNILKELLRFMGVAKRQFIKHCETLDTFVSHDLYHGKVVTPPFNKELIGKIEKSPWVF